MSTARHYERTGLLSPARLDNGYRVFSEKDVARAERIRDMIMAGFSTREIRLFANCLKDDETSPGSPRQCVLQFETKLRQIETAMAELAAKRRTVLERLASARTRIVPVAAE